MRAALMSAAPNLPGALAWPAGLPTPAVVALTLAGLLISAALAWKRLQLSGAAENHRHSEVMTVITHKHVRIDATAVVIALRTGTPNQGDPQLSE